MKKILLPLIAICLMVVSCDVLQSLADQASAIANLANCEYSLKNVSNVSVAGVNLKQITNGNITAADVLKLAAALQKKEVPLAMDVNVDVKNPTTTNAKLTTIDWIMDIDNAKFADGSTHKSYNINAGKTTAVPLGVNSDLYSLFSKNGIESLKNFARSFTSDGTSSKVGLRIRPNLQVGSMQVPLGDYFKLEKKTGSSAASTSTTTTTPKGKK